MNGPPLPSLNALYAFEVAARHGSFTKAAAELHVTQTAVSHQVKQLETELDVLLFRRTGRSVVLTPAGLAWQAELARVFERLRDANRRLRAEAKSERRVVSLTTIPSFGTRWLIPRLGSFLAAHPDIDLRISTSDALVDFASDSVDVGIRFGRGRYPGLRSEKLLDDHFVVVATPAHAAKVRRPRDLLEQVLLSDDHDDAWPRFAESVGLAIPSTTKRRRITDSGLLVEAAARGQGVALARRSLIVDELRTDRLRILLPEVPTIPVGFAYHLVGLRETFRRPEVAAFREWLHRAIGELADDGQRTDEKSRGSSVRARGSRARVRGDVRSPRNA